MSLVNVTQNAELDESLAVTISDCLSGRLREAVESVPQELFTLPDSELEELGNINKIDRMLRIQLWEVYGSSMNKNEVVQPRDVFNGICTRQNFYYLLNIPAKVAYYMRQPPGYLNKLKEAHEIGINKLRDEILRAKVVDADGNMDPKAATVLLKAIEFLDVRVKGAIVHRVETKNLNVDVTADLPSTPEDVELLRARVNEMRERLNSPSISSSILPSSSSSNISIDTKKLVGSSEDNFLEDIEG
jgi:hypothetical protein